MPKYRSREEMMKHRLSIRIKGTPAKVDAAALLIADQLAQLGTVVEWTEQKPDQVDPNKVHIFLNVDTGGQDV